MESIEAGVFRADIPTNFVIDKIAIDEVCITLLPCRKCLVSILYTDQCPVCSLSVI